MSAWRLIVAVLWKIASNFGLTFLFLAALAVLAGAIAWGVWIWMHIYAPTHTPQRNEKGARNAQHRRN